MKCVPIEAVLGTEKLERFTTVARQYCGLFEDKQPVMPEIFLSQMLRVLLELYAATQALDLVDLRSNEDYEITKIDLHEILRRVADKIGNNRFYWSVFAPTSLEETVASCGDLLDDFGDIYKHLNHSLRIFDLGTADSQENAVWEFQFDFLSHWSDHCVNAIRALHYFIQNIEE